jgi:hypothetical protein
MKDFVAAGKAFNQDFCIMPLYDDSASIFKPQDVPNSEDQLSKFYRHRIGNNSVSGRMKIWSNSMIAQLKHNSSSFKQYLLHERVHINYVQLEPEEGIVMGWITGSHPAFTHSNGMREALSNMMGQEVEGLEWALYPKLIYYTHKSDNVKLSTTGVTIQVTNKQGMEPNLLRETITQKWQRLNICTGGSLFGKHFIPFGRSSDMGDAIMTQIIHQQNTLLKQTKHRILQNLNYINEVIEMPLSEDISFTTDSAFTIREAFTCYKDKQDGPLFTSIESTQMGGTYRFLFNEKYAVEVDKALLSIDAKLKSIGSWNESNVHS